MVFFCSRPGGFTCVIEGFVRRNDRDVLTLLEQQFGLVVEQEGRLHPQVSGTGVQTFWRRGYRGKFGTKFGHSWVRKNFGPPLGSANCPQGLEASI